MVPKKPSSTSKWKTIYSENSVEDNITTTIPPTSTPPTVTTPGDNVYSGDSTATFVIFGSMIIVFLISFIIGTIIFCKKRKAYAKSHENVELCENVQLRRSKHRTMKHREIVVLRNGSPPPTKKSRQEGSGSGFANFIAGIHFLIQGPDNEMYEVPLNDRDSWLNNPLSLGERIDLEEGSAISFFKDNNLITGKLVFKGTPEELQTYLSQFPKPSPFEEAILTRLTAAEETIKTLSDALTETRTDYARLEDRLKRLERKNRSRGTVIKTSSTWQTMIEGVPRLISALPNVTQLLMNKINAFRGRSSEITSPSRGDLREMLYNNQAFFIANYFNANACAGAVYKLLFGPEVAKKAFLPPPFYSQGPRIVVGQRKPCLSFQATTAFFLALDLVIANVFTPDQRLTFINHGRVYINRAVNTLKKHGNNRGGRVRDWQVVAYDDGYGFTEEEALVDDYARERDTVATNEACIRAYNWATQMGLNYDRLPTHNNGGNDGDDDDNGASDSTD